MNHCCCIVFIDIDDLFFIVNKYKNLNVTTPINRNKIELIREKRRLLNVDLNQQEDLVSDGNDVIQSRFALPFQVYFIPFHA